MKTIKTTILCFLLAFLLPLTAQAQSAKILMEATSQTVLAESNASARLPMASVTKIMTAYVVLKNAELDEMVKIDGRSAGIEGSSMYLKAGQSVSVKDLLYGLMLVSGNDAAMALAIHVGGSVEGFVSMMNTTAKELQLHDTCFQNPSGLPDEGHYTSAYDFARLTCIALQNSVFSEIVKTKTYAFGDTTLVNHNRLLRELDGCIGVKTGYTKASGRCLASAVERDGVRLICITLNCSDDWNVHKTLYETNFSRCERKKLLTEKEIYRVLKVAGGHDVAYYCEDAYGVVVDGNMDLVISESVPNFIYANKQKGDVIGKAKVMISGKTVAESPLILDRDTRILRKPVSKFKKFFQFILHLFGF